LPCDRPRSPPIKTESKIAPRNVSAFAGYLEPRKKAKITSVIHSQRSKNLLIESMTFYLTYLILKISKAHSNPVISSMFSLGTAYGGAWNTL